MCQVTIRRLINERPELFDFGNIRISIVYIQLGGNDLSRQSAEKTATDLVSFANLICVPRPVHSTIMIVFMLCLNYVYPAHNNSNYV
jgi:hypothetical protein